MKLSVLLFIVSQGILAQAVMDKEKTIEMMKQCKEKTKAEEDLSEIIEKHKLPTSAEGKCMMHCILEAKGLMQGDKANTQRFVDYFEALYAKEPDRLEVAAKAVAACNVNKNSWEGLDRCEIASRIFQCGQDNHVNLS